VGTVIASLVYVRVDRSQNEGRHGPLLTLRTLAANWTVGFFSW
jgi:hypothetical protein